MSTQKFSIALVAGCAATKMESQLQSWTRRRQPLKQKALWASDAWSPKIQKHVDEFAKCLRNHSSRPPVVYFAEWVDMWSAGNWFHLFDCQSDGVYNTGVAGRRFEIFWHCLPDEGRLSGRLQGEPQFAEDAWLRQRVHEAIDALASTNADRGILLLVREPIGATVLDEEVAESVLNVPEWVSDICRDASS